MVNWAKLFKTNPPKDPKKAALDDLIHNLFPTGSLVFVFATIAWAWLYPDVADRLGIKFFVVCSLVFSLALLAIYGGALPFAAYKYWKLRTAKDHT